MAVKIKTLGDLVEEVIDANPKALLDYRGGSKSAIDRLVMEVCKRSGGRADPKKVRAMIISKL